MKLIEARVENFMGIELVEIEIPEGGIQIAGKNGAGKSSLMNALAVTLGGLKLCPKDPVRRGADSAEVSITLDNGLVITRHWNPNTLTIKSAEGMTQTSPQAWLDERIGPHAFDPLALRAMSPAKQRDVYLKLAGLDLSEIDGRRSGLYRQRHDVNVALKLAKARVGEPVEGAPAERVEVAELRVDRSLAAKWQASNDSTRARAVIARERACTLQASKAAVAAGAQQRVDDAERRITRAEEELKAAQADAAATLKARDVAISSAEQEWQDADGAATGLEADVGKLEDPDLESLDDAMVHADRLNRLFEKSLGRAKRVRDVARLQSVSDGFTAQMGDCDQEKADLIEDASLPVEGIGISDDGLTYNGHPLETTEASRQIQVCVAICAAAKPQLAVCLVEGGDSLDRDRLAELMAACSSAGIQPVVERRTDAGSAIVITSGRVSSGEGGDAKPE